MTAHAVLRKRKTQLIVRPLIACAQRKPKRDLPNPVRAVLAKPCSERMEKLGSPWIFRAEHEIRLHLPSCPPLPTFRPAHRADIGRENACRMSRPLGFRVSCPGEPALIRTPF